MDRAEELAAAVACCTCAGLPTNDPWERRDAGTGTDGANASVAVAKAAATTIKDRIILDAEGRAYLGGMSVGGGGGGAGCVCVGCRWGAEQSHKYSEYIYAE